MTTPRRKTTNGHAGVRILIRKAAKVFGTTEKKILSKGRENAVTATARQAAIFAHKTKTKATNAKTAAAFRRSAPAVTHSMGVIAERMKKDRDLKRKVLSLTR